MIVICLEGCHGSGKTQLCQQFENAGYTVLDEAFMDMPTVQLHPQSFVMENIWVSRWIQRLLLKQKELGADEKRTIYFADRSPYSAMFYSKRNGQLLEPIIREQLNELRTEAGIFTYTVYLRVPSDLLWQRIQQRLLAEPFRLKYNEDSRSWMETTVAFYEQMMPKWDFVFENSTNSLTELMISLAQYLMPRVHGFVNLVPDVEESMFELRNAPKSITV